MDEILFEAYRVLVEIRKWDREKNYLSVPFQVSQQALDNACKSWNRDHPDKKVGNSMGEIIPI